MSLFSAAVVEAPAESRAGGGDGRTGQKRRLRAVADLVWLAHALQKGYWGRGTISERLAGMGYPRGLFDGVDKDTPEPDLLWVCAAAVDARCE